jgi:ribonucleoside-diphosphate reductase alpha chain
MEVKKRDEVMKGITVKVKLACGNLYVTINRDKEDNLFEVFVQMGKAGGCAYSQLEAIARLISLALRCGIPAKEIIKQLENIRCPNISYYQGKQFFSCADAIAKILKEQS